MPRMVFLSVLLFICSLFFFLKSMHENSSDDRVLAFVLLVVALFALFTGLAALRAINQYGI